MAYAEEGIGRLQQRLDLIRMMEDDPEPEEMLRMAVGVFMERKYDMDTFKFDTYRIRGVFMERYYQVTVERHE